MEKSWMKQGLSNSGIEGKRVFARGVGGKALNWSNKVAARSAGRWNNALIGVAVALNTGKDTYDAHVQLYM